MNYKISNSKLSVEISSKGGELRSIQDAEGKEYGWAKVLDYIGVGWDPTTIGGNCKGQMSIFDM